VSTLFVGWMNVLEIAMSFTTTMPHLGWFAATVWASQSSASVSGCRVIEGAICTK